MVDDSDYIEDTYDELSPDEVEALDEDEVEAYYASLDVIATAVSEEVADIASDEVSYASDTSLAALSEVAYADPLNPKSTKNLKQKEYVAKTLGRNTIPSSRTTGKRWISIQAYNHQTLQDQYDWSNLETALTIAVTKKPSNGGASWDEVINVEDVTQYNAVDWQASLPPNTSPGKLTVVNDPNHFYLKYSGNAFNPGPAATNIPYTNGYFELDLKVTFASGHMEFFTSQNYPNDNGPILCPVGKDYVTMFDYYGDPYGLGVAATKSQEVKKCEIKFGTEWYTKGQNILKSINGISNYSN